MRIDRIRCFMGYIINFGWILGHISENICGASNYWRDSKIKVTPMVIIAI